MSGCVSTADGWGPPQFPSLGNPFVVLIGCFATSLDGALDRVRGLRVQRNPARISEATDAGKTVDFDAEMARRSGAGEARAQAWLMRRVLPVVRRVARTFFGRAAEADDAAQICLMAILKASGQFRGDASLDTWARRISVRTTIKYARRERRLRPVAEESSSHQKVVDAGPDPQQKALTQDLRVYLGGLSDVQREAVLMHHALGYSVAEIAKLTDASPNTVKSRLRVGMASLRKRVRRESGVAKGGHSHG